MHKKLKILVITDRYPPDHAGGYELRINNIVDALIKGDISVEIITSKPKRKIKDGNSQIHRILEYPSSGKNLIQKVFFDLGDIWYIHKVVDRFSPDLIYFGHTINLTKLIFPYFAKKNVPIIYDEGGIGLLYAYQHHGPWMYFLKKEFKYSIFGLIKKIIIQFVTLWFDGEIPLVWDWPINLKVIYNSYLNQKNAHSIGVPVKEDIVIHSGVDTELFKPANKKLDGEIVIILPGRFEPKKGQLDAILLLKTLQPDKKYKLIFAGKINDHNYYNQCIDAITENNLNSQVRIYGQVSSQELAQLYSEAHFCFFPSYHRTGFSRVPLEAMASGCIVISYGNEGSDEVIENGVNGFIVSEGNIMDAISIITELVLLSTEFANINLITKNKIDNRFSIQMYLIQIVELCKKFTNEKSIIK